MSQTSSPGAPRKAHKFTVWGVALMTAAAVLSLRGLPMMAQEGLTMWFYIGFATLFFLIPGAFVTHWHLSSIDWLNSLPDAARQQLHLQTATLDFRDGQTIFAPMPEPDAVFILVQGLVRIYRLSSEGAEFTLGYVKPGEVFGELAAYDSQPRESFANAIDSCTVLKIPVSLFRDLMQSIPNLGFSVTKQIEGRFKRIERRAEDLVFRSVSARLAATLLMLMEDFGDDRGGHSYIRLHLTQAEFATLVGAARPTINQTFHQFRTAGLASFEKGHVVILNPAGLREIAESPLIPSTL